jgi:hypothetical protein
MRPRLDFGAYKVQPPAVDGDGIPLRAHQLLARQLQLLPYISDWEKNFCFSVKQQRRELSVKQSKVLNRISRKARELGYGVLLGLE